MVKEKPLKHEIMMWGSSKTLQVECLVALHLNNPVVFNQVWRVVLEVYTLGEIMLPMVRAFLVTYLIPPLKMVL